MEAHRKHGRGIEPGMAPQQPLCSGFGAQTTTREVISDRRLNRATAIVTGGYAGIGLETTRVLAAAGAQVIASARDLAKATAPLASLANVTIDEVHVGVPATIDRVRGAFRRSTPAPADQQLESSSPRRTQAVETVRGPLHSQARRVAHRRRVGGEPRRSRMLRSRAHLCARRPDLVC